MRQVKDIAQALGQFMEKDAVNDIPSIDEKETDTSSNSNHKDLLDSKIEKKRTKLYAYRYIH